MSSSDGSDWKETSIKVEKKCKTDCLKPKYSQKFCEKWMNMFTPWLARCEDDPSKPFCRACQCRLDSNRCHLQRHERTTKHARNMEILVNKGEVAARQNLSIRQERSKYYQQRKKLNSSILSCTQEANLSDVACDTLEDYIEEADGETYFQFVQTDALSGNQFSDENTHKHEPNSMDEHIKNFQQGGFDYKIKSHENAKNTENYVKKSRNISSNVTKKERMKLFMQIQKDKSDLMDSFKDLMSTAMTQSPREKNHVDLFFESVSSSVKALTPKLVAEAKLRIMELICELELREMPDNNANITTSTTTSTMVKSPVDNTKARSYVINTPVNSKIDEDNEPVS